MTEEDLKNPKIVRTAEEVIKAHDLLGFVLENPDHFEELVHPHAWHAMESALGVLCWLLGHNDHFDSAMEQTQAMIRIASARDGWPAKEVPVQ